MSKIDRQKLLSETKQFLYERFPTLVVTKTTLEDRNSFFNLHYGLEGPIELQITVDLMDSLLSFFIIRLDKEGNAIPGYDTDQEGRPTRVYFSQLFAFLKIPFDRKKSSELFRLPSNFYLKENSNEMLLQKIKDGLLFFAPILNNEQSILSELQDIETWEKMK